MSQVPLSKKNFIMKKSNIQDYYVIDSANLGAGTYGTVKKVTHKITKLERAVKIIPRNKIKNMERFKMEVDILRTVDHPNIVKFYEWFEDEKNVYLVMEYTHNLDCAVEENFLIELLALVISAKSRVLLCLSRSLVH